MSRTMEAAPIVFPYSSLTGETDTDTGNVVPSLRRLLVSKCEMRSPFLTLARISAIS